MDGELLFVILSSVAQQEVENISTNVKKGLKMKMQRGELVGFQTLSENNAGKQLVKIEKDIRALEAKRAKLVDMRLEEVLDKETYESNYLDLTGQIEQLQAQRRDLQEAAESENAIKNTLRSLKRCWKNLTAIFLKA